jgi:hypothetical protein
LHGTVPSTVSAQAPGQSCEITSVTGREMGVGNLTSVATRPYWVEFPGATPDGFLVRNHNCPSLERAIEDAQHALGWVPKSDGSPGNDAYVAVITNRDTGYRWILHRGSATVEFQTPDMLAEQIAGDYLDVYLSVEEAEVLADAAESAETPDKRKAAVVRQAVGQIRLLAGQVREARRRAETNIHPHTSLRRGF